MFKKHAACNCFEVADIPIISSRCSLASFCLPVPYLAIPVRLSPPRSPASTFYLFILLLMIYDSIVISNFIIIVFFLHCVLQHNVSDGTILSLSNRGQMEYIYTAVCTVLMGRTSSVVSLSVFCFPTPMLSQIFTPADSLCN